MDSSNWSNDINKKKNNEKEKKKVGLIKEKKMYSSNRSDDIKARPWSNTGTLGFTISINPGNDDRDK